ncbi:alpha,alpha-trehalase nth1 [Perkinsus olseni]|uniref:Trehalase n=1 Tax=Perkinsus olseni TaxID=32597 RepID=A0A7J6NQG4_PEROL|nr:alpha,alpha-trehalase nth1 [Perkinsus olseni]
MAVDFPVPTLQTAFSDPLPALREAIAEYAWPSLKRHLGPDPESILSCMEDPKITKPQPKPVPVHEPPKEDDEEKQRQQRRHWKRRNPDWRARKAGGGDYEVYANALVGYPARVKLYPGMPRTVKDFDKMEPGLLALEFGAEYIVPGGRFTSMYGWDRYFLNRSQPPFLSSTLMALLPYIKNDTKLVSRATAAIVKEYDNVWKCGHRYDRATGLSRYDGHPETLCRATEIGHYAWMKDLTGNARKRAIRSDMAIQESGHDTTARLTRTDACDIATVDLNCILYRIESDLASRRTGGREKI